MEETNTCLNCNNFCIWDGDPACIKLFCISLPKLPCEYFNECTKLHADIHTDEWNYFKEKFFSENTISEDLKVAYLKLFPEDEGLINR